MGTNKNLGELNDFQKFREFIKDFIINDENLFKSIFYSSSSPMDLELPDDPYSIFPEDNPNASDELDEEHGVVLFRRKFDQIQSREGITILIDQHSADINGNYYWGDLYIIFRIILKGVNIQTLNDGSSRSHVIARHIINNFDRAIINNIGEVKYKSYKDLSTNEENGGYMLTFNAKSCVTNINENVNYRKRKYGV